MSLVSNPNGLLIAGALFALAGIVILARAAFTTFAAPHADDDTALQHSQAKVALWFGLPMLAAGLFLNAAGQFATTPLGAGLTALLLALAFVLLVYGMSESLWVDQLATSERQGAVSETRRLAPPAQPPKLITVESREDDKAATDAPRQALPA